MRKLIASAVLVGGALIAWACVPAGQSVFLVANMPLSTECEPDFDLELGAGTLNLAQTDVYYAAFSMESTMVASETTANGVSVDSPSSNDFIASEAVLNYFTIENGTRAPLGLTEQIVPLLAVVPPGADRGEEYIALNILSPAAATAIAALPKPVDVLVALRLDGRLRGGTSLSTNTVEYPIRVVDVAPACASGQTVVVTPGPCGNPGQDTGAGFTCVAAADGGVQAPVDPSFW